MTVLKCFQASILLLGLAGNGPAGEPAVFTSKPRAVQAGNETRIQFAISAPTDVEVAILDARGQVVRHLAAGVLGDHAPAPFGKGLSQDIMWDGKNNLGALADGGPFKARVGLGLKPVLDRMIGDNPGVLAPVRGLACGPGGELFVFHCYASLHPSDGTTVCTVYSREGKYLRTIMPYPANLPEDKLKGLRRLKMPDGGSIPFIYQAETRSLIPGLGDLPGTQPAVSSSGRIFFIGHQECATTITRYNQPGIKQVVAIHSDGSTPPEGVLGPVLGKGRESGCLAVTPDGKTIYATTYEKESGNLFRASWGEEKPTAFGTGFKKPVGVAVGGDGNVYVSDPGGGRIAVLKPDGSVLGEMKLAAVGKLAVHPTTGALYVLAGGELRKYASWQTGTPAAVMTFDKKKAPWLLALDASAEPPVLWMGSGSGIGRVEDKGDSFGGSVALGDRGDGAPTVQGVLAMALDRAHNRLLVGGLWTDSQIFDLSTGKWAPAIGRQFDGTKGGMGSFGLDGKLYTQHWSQSIRRYSADLKVMPFAAGAANRGSIDQGNKIGSIRLRGRGVTADAAGNVHALWQKHKGMAKPGDQADANSLAVYGPDGTVKNPDLIDSGIRQLSSVRLDYQGNIYLAAGVRPAGRNVPADFDGLELNPPVWKSGGNTCEAHWYSLMYGCILKFGPEGGEIRQGIGGTPVEYSWPGTRKTEIKGAKWMFFGASPVASWRLNNPDTCLCESPRFDVDGYGRSFFPDAARFRCGVLDSNGNLIGWFGGYGNADSAGPKSRIQTPEIPFCWPYNIEAGDDNRVYVGDRMNRRVVAVRLDHETEAICEIK